MKDLSAEDAIGLIAGEGYDGVELAVRPDWNSAPDRMPPERRSAIRDLIRDKGLKLTALMEHLFPSEKDEQHRAGLERLRRVAALGPRPFA